VLAILVLLFVSCFALEADVVKRDELDEKLFSEMFSVISTTSLDNNLTAVSTRKEYELDGWTPAVNLMRHDSEVIAPTTASKFWAFGAVILIAPDRPGVHPLAYLFVAHLTVDSGVSGEWCVALEGTPAFYSMVPSAPLSIVPEDERVNLLSSSVGTENVMETLTGMSLPYGVGQQWGMGGGPHGWGGFERPFSSLDLSGGDQRILAVRGGTAYNICNSGRGWIRVVHDNGYTTDYYHLWNNINTSPVGYLGYLGDTGVDVSCGGRANGRHVHFALRVGNGYVQIHYKTFGGWQFVEGGSAYQGWAQRGGARVPSGSCCIQNMG